MRPEYELILWLLALALVVAYGFWRSFRVLYFKQDMMTLRDELRAAVGDERLRTDPTTNSLDYAIYLMTENAGSLRLFDLAVAQSFDRRDLGSEPGDAELEFVHRLVDALNVPDLRDILLRFLIRSVLYMAFESVSGIATCLVWSILIGFKGLLNRRIALDEIGARMIRLATSRESSSPQQVVFR